MPSTVDTAPPLVPVRARVPLDLVDQLRDHAEANDRTLSAELRRAIRSYFQKTESPGSDTEALEDSAGQGRRDGI